MEDHTAAIRLVSWFLLIVSACSIGTRTLVKWSAARKFNLDDLFVGVSFLFSLGSGIAISFAAEKGLGRGQESIKDGDTTVLEKTILVTELFYILSLLFGKLSVVFFVRMLFVTESQRRINLYVGSGVGLVYVATFLAACFQCKAPHVWAFVAGSCYNIIGFWRFLGVFNIVGDLSLIAMPILMLHNAHIVQKKKAIIIGCFSVWILDIAANATQLAYTDGLQSDRYTLAAWPWLIGCQVIQSITLVSTCLPYLRQFLEAFPSGMLQSDEIRRRGLTYADISEGFAEEGNRTYILRDVSKNGSSTTRSVEQPHQPTSQQDVKAPGSTDSAVKVCESDSTPPRLSQLRDTEIGVTFTVDVTRD